MSCPRIRWRWLAALVAAIVLLAPSAAPTLRAHDLRVTHATLTFSSGRYQLDVIVDPESLLARLEIHSDRTPSTGLTADQIVERIHALTDVALARTAIEFDGVPASPTVQFLPTSTVPPGGSSEAPPGAPLREHLPEGIRGHNR